MLQSTLSWRENVKWAIIQGYCARFHALRALIFSGDTVKRAIRAYGMPSRLSMSMKAFSRHRYSRISISPCARVKAQITDAFTQGPMPAM